MLRETLLLESQTQKFYYIHQLDHTHQGLNKILKFSLFLEYFKFNQHLVRFLQSKFESRIGQNSINCSILKMFIVKQSQKTPAGLLSSWFQKNISTC